MGGSPPSAPTIVMPAPTAPTLYRSQVPLESYKQASDYVRRLTERTESLAQQRYQEVGTPGEIGARQAQRRLKEEAAYQSSLPKGDKYIQESSGEKDPYLAARQASELATSSAAQDYARALERAREQPTPIAYEEPEWAKSTVPETQEPESPEASKPEEQKQESKGVFRTSFTPGVHPFLDPELRKNMKGSPRFAKG